MIVAFGYNKRVGKDTCAKLLNTYLRCSRPGLNIKTVKFANKLKDIAYQLYGWAGLQPGIFYESTEGAPLKEVGLPKLNGKSPRDIWIEIGNKLREVYQDTWLDYALFGVTGDIIIISDLRFRNEGQRVLDVGGRCYKVTRPDMPVGADEAEIDLNGWDGFFDVIENHEDIRSLNTRMEVLGEELLSLYDATRGS